MLKGPSNYFAKYFVIALVVAIFGLQVLPAYAAVMSVTPPSGTYTVGQTIAVTVLMASSAQSANAMSGTIKFPQNKLQVVTLSKAGSVVQLWAAEPVFSNADGTIHFEGVIPNPGYTGPGGKIITIYFKAIATGQAPVIYTNASVLANDGEGTDILTNFTNAEYTLQPAPEVPITTATPAPATITPGEAPTPTPTPVPAVVTSVVSTSQLRWWQQYWSLLLAFLLMLLLFLLYMWYMTRKLKGDLRHQLAKFDSDFHRAFHLLRDDIAEHIDELEQARGTRSLSAEEQKFISYFRHNIKDTEAYLEKDLKSLKDSARRSH
ncbi:cohesin domain-containing protein [Candidatus Parcubacteria bacterium]|nr:cohesin domain-containing protein [Candidatus Parcubacteria bacterium]